MKPKANEYSFPVIPSHRRVSFEAPPVADVSEIREFYDPVDALSNVSDEALLASVALTRHAGTLPGIGVVNGYETILAETLHAQLDDVDSLPIPISDERREFILSATRYHAQTIAHAVWDVAGEIVDQFGAKPRNINGAIVFLPRHIVLSGKVSAMVAHQSVRRRSGRAYFMHPDEAASTLTIAWRKQGLEVAYPGEPVSEEARKLDIHRFLTYKHDGYEDTADRSNVDYPNKKEPPARYLADPVIMTPLVAEELLKLEGVDEARTISRALLGLTRVRDSNGKRMAYNAKYIPRGIRIGGEYFVVPKAADMNHNLNIEPDKIIIGDKKTAQKLDKRDTYERAAVQVKRAAEEYGENIAQVVHAIFAVTPEEIMQESHRKYPLDIEYYANRVRQTVAKNFSEYQL